MFSETVAKIKKTNFLTEQLEQALVKSLDWAPVDNRRPFRATCNRDFLCLKHDIEKFALDRIKQRPSGDLARALHLIHNWARGKDSLDSADLARKNRRATDNAFALLTTLLVDNDRLKFALVRRALREFNSWMMAADRQSDEKDKHRTLNFYSKPTGHICSHRELLPEGLGKIKPKQDVPIRLVSDGGTISYAAPYCDGYSYSRLAEITKRPSNAWELGPFLAGSVPGYLHKGLVDPIEGVLFRRAKETNLWTLDFAWAVPISQGVLVFVEDAVARRLGNAGCVSTAPILFRKRRIGPLRHATGVVKTRRDAIDDTIWTDTFGFQYRNFQFLQTRHAEGPKRQFCNLDKVVPEYHHFFK